MSSKNGLLLKFESDDPKSDGLDPDLIDGLCIFGETNGLVHKQLNNTDDGDIITLEIHFECEALLSEWVDDCLPEPYYKVALRV